MTQLEQVIEHAGHLLPAQGPITVFIHHNTLHAFEDLSFDDAVVQAGRQFGCQPYLPEDCYRQELDRGRIRAEDLEAALIEDLGDHADALLGFLGTRFHLRLAMLQAPLRIAPPAELRWFVSETDALTRYRSAAPPAARERFLRETRHWVMRDLRNGRDASHAELLTPHERHLRESLAGLFEHFGRASIERWSDATWEAFSLHALWRVCRDGVQGLKADVAEQHSRTVRPQSETRPQTLRHRDLLLQATGADSDRLVHEVLIRYCAAFLDQGFAPWPLPEREQGFYRSFCAVYGLPGGAPDHWLRGLPAELARLQAAGIEPLASILESLELLGVPSREWEEFIAATLLALRGWAGMIRQVEERADAVAHPIPRGSLVEYVAVRLILERLALAHVAREQLGFTGPLADLRHETQRHIPPPEPPNPEQRAFLVFQLAQLLGWLPRDLHRLNKHEWSRLVGEIEAFSNLDRRRVFHRAYERRYRIQTLDAVSVAARRPARSTPAPKFQIICCLDEREESFRRHIEELAPDGETFGAAGFFSVAIYYRGAADAHFVPLCPVVIRPQHWVREEVVYTFEESHRRRSGWRRLLGAASHQAHVGSRTFTGGALLSGIAGPLASVPLIARVWLPRWTAQIRKAAARLVQPPPVTQLRLERTAPTPGPQDEQIGYTVPEMADIVERLLRDIGLTTGLARLVVVTGHGSSSLNNPHESAHDCGACGGGRGGPNARSLASMANDPRVRTRLVEQGLVIPAQTVFVGAYHNTCDESLTFYDLDRLPATHKAEFAEVQRLLDEARERNAHERCRRFESAPLSLTPEAALRHVEARAEDLAQTRPEYGHATNAVCMVGRRSRTRGLYMDRRTFLVSYDPAQDDADQTVLTRILQAVVPVCGGINLEYYFSFVDPPGWGCGTKLPHNITSLLGIMDGAASDLRPGLPWQMVEVHEPVRLLFIIETTPEGLLRIMERQPAIGTLCRNGWVQLACLSPDSPRMHLFRNGRFEPYAPDQATLPEVDTSSEWYRGWREHLGYALVRRGVRHEP